MIVTLPSKYKTHIGILQHNVTVYTVKNNICFLTEDLSKSLMNWLNYKEVQYDLHNDWKSCLGHMSEYTKLIDYTNVDYQTDCVTVTFTDGTIENINPVEYVLSYR